MIWTNLAAVEFWGSQVPFADAMKCANRFMSKGQPVTCDSRGWPLVPGSCQILRYYPSGQYSVTWKGNGKFNFGKVPFDAAGGTLNYTSSEKGTLLTITETDPADPLRDIEVRLAPGTFNPEFIETIKPYRGLRFMNWQKTSGPTGGGQWAERAKVDDQTYTGDNGVPLEVMCELCNMLDVPPWFCMHDMWDDVTVAAFSEKAKELLKPDLKVYLEHSNEVWNGFMRASGRCAARGAALGINGVEYHGLRTVQIGLIWRKVFFERLINILGAHAVRLLSTIVPLDYVAQHFSGSVIDAVAIAPYMKLKTIAGNAEKYKAMPMDELFAEVRGLISVPGEAGNVNLTDYREMVESRGMKLIVYECGQHLRAEKDQTGDAELNEKFWAFNRDPRIKPLYMDYFKHLKDALGDVPICHFTDCAGEHFSGSWGAKLYQGQPREDAPKFDALMILTQDRRVGPPDRRIN